jgi:phosphomannomutase
MGADLVGMSTALEAIAARAEGMEVLAVSLVTNLAAGMTGQPLDHAEVLEAGARPRPASGSCSRRWSASCERARGAVRGLARRRPRPGHPGELRALLEAGRDRRARRPLLRAAALRDRRAARAGAGRPERHEPRRWSGAPPPGSPRSCWPARPARSPSWSAATPGTARWSSRPTRAPCWPVPGVRALLLPRDLPTPVLAFAVLHLGADAGVMVTASHNPPPTTASRSTCPTGRSCRHRSTSTSSAGSPRSPRCSTSRSARPRCSGGRLAGLPVADLRAAAQRARDVRVAYTPMHGVGLETLLAAFAAAGFAAAVGGGAGRAGPDFPTVAFPNPEEPGAWTCCCGCPATPTCASPRPGRRPHRRRGRATAGCAATRPASCSPTTCCRRGCAAGWPPRSSARRCWLRVAAAYGVPFSETLTGFKHLARAGDDLVYAYEEALGVAVAPGTVRDKDGMSAALLVAELAALEKARGRTLLDRLAELERGTGRHETRQLSYRVSDLALISAAVDDVRAHPPASYGAFAVAAVEQPAEDVLVHRLKAGRVVVRPSGTEPKLKAYLELVDAAPGDLDALAAAVEERLGLAR